MGWHLRFLYCLSTYVRNSGKEYGACSVLFFCSVVDFWTRSFGRCTRFPNRNPPIDPLNTEVALLPLVVLLLVQGVAAGDGGALILLSHSRINGAAREGKGAEHEEWRSIGLGRSGNRLVVADEAAGR